MAGDNVQGLQRPGLDVPAARSCCGKCCPSREDGGLWGEPTWILTLHQPRPCATQGDKCAPRASGTARPARLGRQVQGVRASGPGSPRRSSQQQGPEHRAGRGTLGPVLVGAGVQVRRQREAPRNPPGEWESLTALATPGLCPAASSLCSGTEHGPPSPGPQPSCGDSLREPRLLWDPEGLGGSPGLSSLLPHSLYCDGG